MTESLLRARALTAAFPGTPPPFERLDLALRAGEWISLSGPNGAGKSTLLAALAGLLPPVEGEVRLDDQPLTIDSPVRAHVGFVFQEPEAHFVTPQGRTEIAFPLENLGWARRAIAERVHEVAARLEIVPLLDRELETLSGGERSRVALAAALASKPRFLLLDEPGNYLDPRLRSVLRETIGEQVEAGAGVLWATQLEEDDAPAHRRLWLEHGRLEEGPEARATRRTKPAVRDVPDPPSSEVVLRARDVRAIAQTGKTLFDGVSLEVGKGELVLVEGESGCGKTRLLSILAGLIGPFSGSVEVSRETGASRPTFGVLLQSPEDQLVGPTVRDDLMVSRARADGHEPWRAALARVGLEPEPVARRAPESLSHGERRRVAWAGLILLDASIWILDEPTAGVDESGIAVLHDLLLEHLRERGSAIIAHQDPRLTEWPRRAFRIESGRFVRQNAEEIERGSSNGSRMESERNPTNPKGLRDKAMNANSMAISP